MIVIVLGLLGLGIVVFVHELGHFLAARWMGVHVEAFSLGWGPKLAGIVRGGTEYRVSVFPIGGYCRMKGEESFKAALERGDEDMPREPGSFYGASPGRRIVIALAGPAANLVFALVVAVVIAAAGYTLRTAGNKVILAAEYPLAGNSAEGLPAQTAGIRTGDRITAIDGVETKIYSQIQEIIFRSPGKPLRFTVERDSGRVELEVTPVLDRETGAGRVGLYAWIDPVVERVAPEGSAYVAGLAPGDRILTVNGVPIEHDVAFQKALLDRPRTLRMEVERDGARQTLEVVPTWDKDGNPDLGITFRAVAFRVQAESLSDALTKGWNDTWSTIAGTLQGLASLFRGNVKVANAVSGPARITYMVGTVATRSLREGWAEGLSRLFNFLSLLSVGLFVMNLMPIPLLDGGQILLFVVEGIRRKPLKLKTVYRYQAVGMAVVLAIFLLTTLADLTFFSGR